MDSEVERPSFVRRRGICRHFINGTCIFGRSCIYRHEWPVAPPSQVCRYFQKGGCWYGEHCRYLHISRSEGAVAAAGRRGSAPAVSSSAVACAGPERRGSEPALLRAEERSRQEPGALETLVDVSIPQQNIGCQAGDATEEQTQGGISAPAGPLESSCSEVAQAVACVGRRERPSIETGDACAGGASNSPEEATNDFLHSKDVTCGICMDKVYEKMDPRNHVFGILPSCDHAFCLQCIMTWRKTKDLGPSVVKTCPQCRVRSAFYVPSKHWVSGRAKERLIAEFKEKSRKKNCSYFARYRCCPFKTECLYRHDKNLHRGSYSDYLEVDYDDDFGLLNFLLTMAALNGDDVDDVDFAFFLADLVI